MNKMNLHPIVLVSPLRRTIHTACCALATHPQKKDLTLRLLPLLTEAMRHATTTPCKASELKEWVDKCSKDYDIKIEYGSDKLNQDNWIVEILP
jgi:hypothetical protein